MLVSMALMLGLGKVVGELFRRFSMPAVVGEITAGIILGPTLLGRISPDAYTWLFSSGSKSVMAIESFVLFGVTLLLLVAGMELDFSAILRQGKSITVISSFNIIIPFVAGFLLARTFPGLFGIPEGKIIPALYIGVALSITALPVITKILMDIKLFQTDFGIMVMASALVNDLAGWIIFSIIIQLFESGTVDALRVLKTILLTTTLVFFILTIVRQFINRAIPWIQAKTEWPGGIITFIVTTGLFFSALTEAIGVHAILGAFLCGIAIGDSPYLKKHTREIINQFIGNIFAPLFFVAIGIRVDFVQNFNPALFFTIIPIAISSKVAASMVGSILSGMTVKESLPIGFAMSTHGAMEIILGMIGRNYGIINNEVFVVIVIMSISTSLASAPLIRIFIKGEAELLIQELLERKLFIPNLKSIHAEGVIKELSLKASLATGIQSDYLGKMVLAREAIMSTGIGCGVAVPHARIYGLQKPLIAVGISQHGVDFNSPDGKHAHLVFLILTPEKDVNSQVLILSQISNIFLDEQIRNESINAASFNEFIAVIKKAVFEKTKLS